MNEMKEAYIKGQIDELEEIIAQAESKVQELSLSGELLGSSAIKEFGIELREKLIRVLQAQLMSYRYKEKNDETKEGN